MSITYKIDHENETVEQYAKWTYVQDGSAQAEAHMKTSKAPDHIEYRVLRKWEVEELKEKWETSN